MDSKPLMLAMGWCLPLPLRHSAACLQMPAPLPARLPAAGLLCSPSRMAAIGSQSVLSRLLAVCGTRRNFKCMHMCIDMYIMWDSSCVRGSSPCLRSRAAQW